ncbi:hypothetical protein Val02_72740 [Virgisporangium aliadipatigenens]|uniref:Uncharacterized protein n=1 Tax=Virgisporangium aliadipatigenens TaxID=741659 RepID=A0A8J3YTX4_9ACTN|nr:hypothetical protein [Virgisporangium aliadipatigenens]GIJ50388.1 hypothetical protein Val02_72740 [Virgisporangium aliadipatigenens]
MSTLARINNRLRERVRQLVEGRGPATERRAAAPPCGLLRLAGGCRHVDSDLRLGHETLAKSAVIGGSAAAPPRTCGRIWPVDDALLAKFRSYRRGFHRLSDDAHGITYHHSGAPLMMYNGVLRNAGGTTIDAAFSAARTARRGPATSSWRTVPQRANTLGHDA